MLQHQIQDTFDKSGGSPSAQTPNFMELEVPASLHFENRCTANSTWNPGDLIHIFPSYNLIANE